MRSDLKKIGEQKSTYLVGQTERALYLLDVISTITDRGNNAEVRRKKDGTLTVYEVKKNMWMATAREQRILHSMQMRYRPLP